MSSHTVPMVRSTPPGRGVERRAAVRYECGVPGSCQTLAGRRQDAWEAVVRDISEGGIGLLLGRRFEPGALLAVEVMGPAEAQSRLLLARVAHATAQPDGGWLIGCALLYPLAPDELQGLLKG